MNITSKKKRTKEPYSELEHAKLIAPIIDRMANNHTKWLYTIFTIIGFSITLDKFLYDLEFMARIIAYSVSTVIIFFMLIVSFMSSKKYFKIENAYRDKQNKVLEGKYKTYSLSPDMTWKTRTTSWIINVAILLIFLSSILQISLIVISSFV